MFVTHDAWSVDTYMYVLFRWRRYSGAIGQHPGGGRWIWCALEDRRRWVWHFLFNLFMQPMKLPAVTVGYVDFVGLHALHVAPSTENTLILRTCARISFYTIDHVLCLCLLQFLIGWKCPSRHWVGFPQGLGLLWKIDLEAWLLAWVYYRVLPTVVRGGRPQLPLGLLLPPLKLPYYDGHSQLSKMLEMLHVPNALWLQ